MNKFEAIVLSAVISLTACNRTELSEAETPEQAVKARYFAAVYPEGKQPVTKGVAQTRNLWYPCSHIKVKFLEDPYNRAAEIEAWAKEWEQHAGITFDFVTSGDADVRIAFNEDTRYVSWSYTGTDCKVVNDQTLPTLSFAYFTDDPAEEISETERRGDVLRVFGMVLGLELEYRYVGFNPWRNETLAREFWENNITDIPWSELKKYVYNNLAAADVIQSQTRDPQSIMVWSIPVRYASKGERYFNYELSDGDAAFIAQLYPKSACDDGAIVTFRTPKCAGAGFIIQVGIVKDITVDWGDGTTEAFTCGDSLAFLTLDHNYPYSTDTKYIIKFFGDNDALIKLVLDTGLDSLDVSKNTNLTHLMCYANDLSSLDVSNNTALIVLDCSGTSLTTLDLSQNVNLTHLRCAWNQLSSLNLTQNTLLSVLECNNNPLTSLNLSQNVNLTKLQCSNTQFSSLNLTQNILLTDLECLNTPLTSLNLSQNVNLTRLQCPYNQLSSLILPESALLTEVYCDSNLLSSLDCSHNINLKRLFCQSNQLSSLILPESDSLTEMSCVGNLLTTLDVSKNVNLDYLMCWYNQLASLDISANTLLTTLWCDLAVTPTLDISQNTLLRTIMLRGAEPSPGALTNFAQSLPDRSGLPLAGHIHTSNIHHAGMSSICAAKNWQYTWF
ncbi:MAG: hypothetical protein LBC98_08090 [Prevotellaceae bacterium]|jgi:hypothetical protein|nr:hypothetical protein [Prevotellaceae bacterium]